MYPMKETDLAYLAGILDGEGAVMVTRVADSRYCGGCYFRVCVQVGNTNRALVEFIDSLFPASIQGPYQPRNSTRAKPVYYWIANGRRSREILRACLPYLRLKRRQAELCIELDELRGAPPILRHNGGRFSAGAQKSPATFARMEAIWKETRALNRRGIAT